MYEEISNTQIDRIIDTDFKSRKSINKLSEKDVLLLTNLAFKLSGKTSLETKEMNYWMEVAIIELVCEKLRRAGILMRTSKGWLKTELGEKTRLSDENFKRLVINRIE